MAAWDKRDSESAKQYTAFCDYRDMGTGRSLLSLFSVYRDRIVSKQYPKPPTTRDQTLKDWSAKFGWVQRCSDWDEYQIQLRDEQIAEQRIEQRGQRQKITVALNGMLVKVMSFKNKEDIQPSELNSLANAAAKILDQSRQEFNDLPTQRKELTGKDGGAIEHKHKLSDLSDDELDKIIGGG